MLTCRQATQLLSERLDRTLQFREQGNLQIYCFAVHAAAMENKLKHSVSFPKSLKTLMRVSSSCLLFPKTKSSGQVDVSNVKELLIRFFVYN